MIVDSSALVAILLAETGIVLTARLGVAGRSLLARLLDEAGIECVATSGSPSGWVCPGYAARYAAGMKIAVSLPDEQVAAARRAVAAGRAPSVSAYVSRALAQAERENSLVELLAELDRELGEPGDAARAWAEQELRRTGLIT